MRIRTRRRRPRAHFLHIGKAGGTAINTALWPVHLAGRYEIVFGGHDVDLRQVPPGDRFFFVVRDPIDRFVSSFNDRQRRSQPRYDIGWEPGEERAYRRFTAPDSLASALSAHDQELRSAAEDAMRSIYHVRHSYWHWFHDPDYFISRLGDLLLVLWLPSLDASFAELCDLLGMPRVELPSDSTAAHRSPADASRHLSEQAIENLRRWYARDFDFVELCSRLDRAASGLKLAAPGSRFPCTPSPAPS